jgi:hypothetical protein
MKIRLVGAELFHAERRTDMTKLIVAFRNFSNPPKICHDTGAEKKTESTAIVNTIAVSFQIK